MNEHTQICQSCGETVEGSYSLLDHESGAHGYVYQCTNMSCMETWEEDEAPAEEGGQNAPQDSQTLTADLKPCPFCGKPPYVEPSGDGTGTMISCITQGCVNPHTSYYGEGVAAKVWNTRAALNQGQG